MRRSSRPRRAFSVQDSNDRCKRCRATTSFPEGPWQFREEGGVTASHDHALLSHDHAVALMPALRLTTGTSSLHVEAIEASSIQPGETVVHVGTGRGYYTAFMAELTGQQGRVFAYELEPELARVTQLNVAESWPQVQVENRSATDVELPLTDVLYVCAGVQVIPRSWLAAIAPAGRVVVAIVPGQGEGGLLFASRVDEARFRARFLRPVRFYRCIGATDSQAVVALSRAFRERFPDEVRALRTDTPRPEAWFVGQNYWLSTLDPG